MKKILLTAALLVFTAFIASAAPLCTDTASIGGNTLDKYMALGASGCYINNVLFANFNYSYTLGTDSFYSSGPAGTGRRPCRPWATP